MGNSLPFKEKQNNNVWGLPDFLWFCAPPLEGTATQRWTAARARHPQQGNAKQHKAVSSPTPPTLQVTVSNARNQAPGK